jgi:hypothetical protein
MQHERLVRIDDEITGDPRHAEIAGELDGGLDAARGGEQHLDDDNRRRHLDGGGFELRAAINEGVRLLGCFVSSTRTVVPSGGI